MYTYLQLFMIMFVFLFSKWIKMKIIIQIFNVNNETNLNFECKVFDIF